MIDRGPDFFHGFGGGFPGLPVSLFQDVPDDFGVAFERGPLLPEGGQYRNQRFDDDLLAFEAADGSFAASPGEFLPLFLVHEGLMEREDRAVVGLPGVRAPLAPGVRHHGRDFFPDGVGVVLEQNRVVVGFAHLPAVGPAELRNFGQEGRRLGEDGAVKAVEAPGDRDEVLTYVMEKYGRGGTTGAAFVCSLKNFGARSALYETARAFGLPPDEARSLTRRLPFFADPDFLKRDAPAPGLFEIWKAAAGLIDMALQQRARQTVCPF